MSAALRSIETIHRFEASQIKNPLRLVSDSVRRFLIIDYETRSEGDLKKLGSWGYSVHPSTRILCVAWRYGTREELQAELDAGTPAKVWSPYIPSPYGELLRALKDPNTILVAHNALFEQAITKNVLSKILSSIADILTNLPPERWLCTAALAASLALPRSLEGACLALGLKIQKDMQGRRLLLKMCKPRKPTKNNPAKWHNSVRDLKRIMEYCKTDVDAETELFLTARPLSKSERKVWELDQKINLRGFLTDQDLVDKALSMIALETKNMNIETAAMTWGAVASTTQRDAMLKWLEEQGVCLPDLRAKTVTDFIASGAAEGDALRLLEIRQAVSKTSTAKYMAFKLRQNDGIVRDNLVYHAASTGRWGGAGVQPQNFPRGSVKDIDTAVEAVKTGDLEWVRFLYGNPMNVLSSVLRGVIIARPGKKFFCADYAAIEVRMAFWFARHEAGLKAFRENRDLYKEMASHIFGIPIDQVTPEQRFIGKTVVLGCQYQMGPAKFVVSCANLGREIDIDLAKAAVETYRRVHYPIKKLWYNLERAAIEAVKHPRKRFAVNRTVWFVENGFLWCQLPSGRRLAYHGPCLKENRTSWGEMKTQLHHWGINQRTRKWELTPTYGGLLSENVVQAASRDLMAAAVTRVEDHKYEVVITVHDELLTERDDDGSGGVKEFEGLMAELPEWADGAPVSAAGWSGYRYRKG